jgi:hypothetical protein
MKRASISLALTIALAVLSWSWLVPETSGNAASKTDQPAQQPVQETLTVAKPDAQGNGHTPAVAMDESTNASSIWLVMEASGDAAYSVNDAAQIPLQRGVKLTQGASVETGDNGKVLLTRGEESVFIGPYTLAVIAAPDDKLQTTIHLQRGQAGFQVGKQKSKHFSVETPFLAAVVKGTRFTVQVSESLAAVAVSEGLVEVRSHKSHFSVDLKPGQNALVNRDGDLALSRKDASVDTSKSGLKSFESELASNLLAKEKKANKQKSSKRSSKKSLKNKNKWNFPFKLGSTSKSGKKGRSSSKSGKGGWSGSWNSNSGRGSGDRDDGDDDRGSDDDD